MPAKNYIAVTEKTMRVLEAFHGERDIALAELAGRTRLVKSNVFRILYTLERLGYVERSGGGRYSMVPRPGWISDDRHPSLELSRLAEPFMAGLLRRFQETVNLGVLDNGEVLYLRVLECGHAFRLAAHAGMRSPVHSTALGKCLLARLSRAEVDALLRLHPLRPLTPRTLRTRAALRRELEKVRLQGYAIDNQEDSPGARCVGAPLLDSSGHVVAAISISGPAVRMKPNRDREIAAALVETCGQISALLRHTPVTTGSAARAL